MAVLYFDCATGLSGNMVLGALLEVLGEGGEEYLRSQLEKLNTGGYELHIEGRESHGISGTHVDVIVDGIDEYGHEHHLKQEDDHGHGHYHDHEHGHHHDHSHEHGQDHEHGHQHHEHHNAYEQVDHYHHEHRNLQDVTTLIEASDLSDHVKELAESIFMKVALAESKVHGKSLDEVHFHEVGAIDSIVDIVGTAILIDKIAPDHIYSSVVSEGHGYIKCAHGLLSVPVPATTEIFAANQVLFKQIDVETELVTPTGAAIIASLAESYDLQPMMTIDKVGYGCGTKDVGRPNVLKVTLGQEVATDNTDVADRKLPRKPSEISYLVDDDLYVIETNIDDSTGEELGYTLEVLIASGAADAFYTPIYMKKNRPAYKLEVICRGKKVDELMEIIFKETTTIGARYYPVDRAELFREKIQIETEVGVIGAKKVTTPAGAVYLYPEYEDMKAAALEHNVSVKEIRNLFYARIQKLEK